MELVVYYIVIKSGGNYLKHNTELFPYESYPIRLEAKNTDGSTVCYFSCVEHLRGYMDRNKSKKVEYQIDYNTKVFSKEEIDKMPGSTTKSTTKSKTTTRTTRTKKTTSPTKSTKSSK